jgi:NAD(P)H dehydrogenase (quinone)
MVPAARKGRALTSPYTIEAMHVLVVHAHPRLDSFNRTLFDTAVNALAEAGHVVESISLYEDGFDPRMTGPERIAYHGPRPIISSQVERYAQAVSRAEGLVFVYPTWWFGLPAILKGWLERVLVPGVAFVFDPARHKVQPNLQRVRRIVGVTTYGSSWWYTKLFTDAGRRTLVRTLRLVCNRSARSIWLGMYGLDTSTSERRQAFLRRVTRTLAEL